MNKKTKIGVIAVAVVLVGGIIINNASAGGPTGMPVETIAATTRNLTSSISATGMVESQTSRGVYSVLNYQIEDVVVEVGDQVTEGDTLCQLDTSDLTLQIAQQRASIGASSAVTGQQINAASQNLSNAQFTNDSGLNAQIISAQANVDNAEYAVRSARADLKSAEQSRSDYNGTTGTTGGSGGSNMGGNIYGTITAEGQSGELGAIVGDVNGTVNIPGSGSYSAGSTGSSDQLDDAVSKARIAVSSAESTLANAKKALQAALNSANIEMDTYEQQLAAARASNNYSAQQIQVQTLEKNLADTTVKAPISGTVTAVYAEEGATGSGLLFIVEDINALKIETKVKEFDVLSVTPGKKVIIESDATGDDSYEGVVATVAPTAIKSSTGTAATAGNTTSEFEVTVYVSSPETRLKVGMNTRLQIITDEKENVQSLPTDAIFTNANGEDAVYIAKQNTDGDWIAEETVVKLGLETDYYIEIANPKFASSDLIIGSTDGIENGMVIALDETTAGSATISSSEESTLSAETEKPTSSEETATPEEVQAPEETSSPAEEETSTGQVTITSAPGVTE